MKADYKLAREKCDSLAATAKDVCVASAKARYNERWSSGGRVFTRRPGREALWQPPPGAA